MHRPVQITPPAILPVSLSEVKSMLRVDHNDDDAVISALIGSAVDHLDGWSGILGSCLVEQVWRQDFDRIGLCLRIPLGPVIEIVSVDYVDQAGVSQVLDPAKYSLVVDAGGTARAELRARPVAQSASLTFRSGYATLAAEVGPPALPVRSAVPDAIKTAIMLMVRSMYVQSAAAGIVKRETVDDIGTREFHGEELSQAFTPAVSLLIAPYRRVGV